MAPTVLGYLMDIRRWHMAPVIICCAVLLMTILGIQIKTINEPYHKGISIHLPRKPHKWNMRYVGERLREARARLHEALWREVND